jgi:hypothetical protein
MIERAKYQEQSAHAAKAQPASAERDIESPPLAEPAGASAAAAVPPAVNMRNVVYAVFRRDLW